MFSTVKNFNDYIINRNTADTLQKFCKSGELMNLILTGMSGTGKLTLARSIVQYYHPQQKISITPTRYKIKVQDSVSKEFNIQSSLFHHEISLNSYNFSDKFSVIGMIKSIIQNRNIYTNSCHIIIIKNGHYLNDLTLKAILKISEQYYDSVRFIITTLNASKLINKLTNFILFRVPCEKQKVIEGYFRETYSDDIDSKLITSNLMETTLNCEYASLVKENGVSESIDPIKTEFDLLFKDIEKTSVNKFNGLREKIGDILCLNVEKNEIFEKFSKRYSKNYEIVKVLAEYNRRMQDTFKTPIHLETMILEIMFILEEEKYK